MKKQALASRPAENKNWRNPPKLYGTRYTTLLKDKRRAVHMEWCRPHANMTVNTIKKLPTGAALNYTDTAMRED